MTARPHRRAAVLAASLVLAALAAPSAASAHAQLEGTSPPRGAVVAHEPGGVSFRFGEPVEEPFGAVRVFDAAGRRVDDGHVTHPGARPEVVGVGLRKGLPDGTYTGTYRVISADGHPVSGGLVFSVGKPGAGPAKTVDELIGAGAPGGATRTGQAIARGFEYLATALGVGLLAFLLLCWRPALAATAGGDGAWRIGTDAFARRARALLLVAVGVGVVAGIAGIVGEGAEAAGTSFWSALRWDVVKEVLHTRFGTIWGWRTVAWVVLGVAATMAAIPRRSAAMAPAALGADGLALARIGPLRAAALAVPALALVVAPAFEGHSDSLSPRAILIACDVLHVGAMVAWLGGLVVLVALVPLATRALAVGDRARLLAAVLGRFSTVALISVAVLIATGVGQAIPYLTALDQLWTTGYGRELLAKIVLLCVLIGFGARNRQQLVPALRTLAAAGASAGAVGRALRRTLRAEVVLVIAVLGVSSVLVDGVPPVSAAANGPFEKTTRLGPLMLQATVDPAQVGANELHLYLSRASDGTQFAATKQIDAVAALPGKGIGTLPIRLRRAGPGHYVADSFQLVPGGTWTITITDRVSAFDEYVATLKVPVR